VERTGDKMTDPIEEINKQAELAAEHWTGGFKELDSMAKALIAANELLQQQQDIIRSLEAKVAQQQKEHKAAILAIYSLSVGLKDNSGVHAAICEFIETQLEERLNDE
jgi:hypothetical protein